MKMTCNGGAPRTLQAAFEINISSLRPLERRPAPAASPEGWGSASVTNIKTENFMKGAITQ